MRFLKELQSMELFDLAIFSLLFFQIGAASRENTSGNPEKGSTKTKRYLQFSLQRLCYCHERVWRIPGFHLRKLLLPIAFFFFFNNMSIDLFPIFLMKVEELNSFLCSKTPWRWEFFVVFFYNCHHFPFSFFLAFCFFFLLSAHFDALPMQHQVVYLY